MKVLVVRNSKLRINNEIVNLFPNQFVGQIGEVFAEKKGKFYGVEFDDDIAQWIPKDCCEVIK